MQGRGIELTAATCRAGDASDDPAGDAAGDAADDTASRRRHRHAAMAAAATIDRFRSRRRRSETAESTARSRALSVTVRDASLEARRRTRGLRSRPADRPASVNCPAALVVAVRVAPVAASRAAIVAPATAAPVGSVTEPAISARPLKGPRSCSICRSMRSARRSGGPAILRVRTSSIGRADRRRYRSACPGPRCAPW